MSVATITAICTGAAGIIAAITGLVIAFKANNKANTATTTAEASAAKVDAHIEEHNANWIPGQQ
jgi:hypothetical protein